MKKILNDKIVGKIIKTFIEGFLASITVTLPTVTTIDDIDVWKAIGIGAVAMGISAVLNLLQNYLEKRNSGGGITE